MVARRAFSLLELLVAGALLALLIALTAVNMRSGRTRAESFLRLQDSGGL